jgi:hypothetical protein
VKVRPLSVLVWLAVPSCVLPKFDVISSFDDGSQAGGGMGGIAGAVGGAQGSSGLHSQQGGEPASGGDPSSDTGDAGASSAGTSGSGTSGQGGSSAGVSGTSGNGGAASCPSPYDLVCNGVCKESATDFDNCGKCFNQCRPTETCTKGVCGCPPGIPATSWCVNQCRPQDDQHCGSACEVCQGLKECGDSKCSLCPTGCAVLNAAITSSFDTGTFQLLFDAPMNLNNTSIAVDYHVGAGVLGVTVSLYNNLGQTTSANLTLGATDWGAWQIPITSAQADFSQSTKLEFLFDSSTVNPAQFYIDAIHVGSTTYDFNTSASAITPVPAKSTVAVSVSFVNQQ